MPGIMSSHVTSSNANTVLLSGKQCGTTKADPVSDSDFSQDIHDITYRAKKYTEYLTYALQCYRGSPNSEKCRTFTRPQLPYKKISNAPCPFTNGLCLANSSSLSLDTGYMSSGEHLGINGKPEFHLRQARQCAPLATDSYKRNYTNNETGQQFVRYYLAPWNIGPDANASDPGLLTWQVPRITYSMAQSDDLGRSESVFPRNYRIGYVLLPSLSGLGLTQTQRCVRVPC